MTGTRLEIVPSQLMAWAAWKDLYPDTLVLDKGRGFLIDTYASYYRGSQSGVIGRAVPDNRLPGKEFVIGLQLFGAEKAYPYRELSRQPVVNDTVGDLDVVITFDATAATGAVWNRAVDAMKLTFREFGPDGDSLMADDETRSTWSMLTGLAVDGPLTGARLTQLPTTPSFWFAWLDLFPATALFEAPT